MCYLKKWFLYSLVYKKFIHIIVRLFKKYIRMVQLKTFKHSEL